jgi:mannose-6-phosphate isomerase-like protein (cupin superfamily)
VRDRKFIWAGLGPDGRSAIVARRSVGAHEPTTRLVSGLDLRSELPAPPASSAVPRVDLDGERPRYPPGTAGWSARRQAPGEVLGMHYTATIDFGVIVIGSTALVLDRGEVELGPGDCVVIDGVPHAWRAGAEGCLLHTLLIGKPIAATD